jgi:hypothetical protein
VHNANARTPQRRRLPHDQEGGNGLVGDHLDVPLEDATLMEEVELISTLMIAASEAEERLAPHHIDQLLGVRPPTGPGQEGTRAS